MRWIRTAAIVGLGLAASGAALRAAFAQDAADGAFDSTLVRELGAKADELALDDQIALVKRIRRSLDKRLLTPTEESWKGYENLRGRADAGLARILTRGLGEGLVTPRGGGAYWSFTKRSNDYDKSPQIELQQGKFSTGFYGGTDGTVVALVGRDLTNLQESAVPERLRTPAAEMRAQGHRFEDARCPAETGTIYAVRAVMNGDCDVLAAFQVVSLDQYGATIAWRVLRTYDVPPR